MAVEQNAGPLHEGEKWQYSNNYVLADDDSSIVKGGNDMVPCTGISVFGSRRSASKLSKIMSLFNYASKIVPSFS